MSFSTQSTPTVSVGFNSSKVLVIGINYDTESEMDAKTFMKEFSYSLNIENAKGVYLLTFPVANLTIREDNGNTILWSSTNKHEILEILSSISENEFFIEKRIIHAGGKEFYSKSLYRRVSDSTRKEFKDMIEVAVLGKR